ncbi:MAG: hypothetical protein QXJ68_00965 [Methanocellales archaeon]
MQVLERSSKKQDLEFMLRLAKLEQGIAELRSEIQDQKKNQYELENKIACIDPILKQTLSLLNQIEEIQSNLCKLSSEVAQLKSDLNSAFNQKIDIASIVKEVLEGGNEFR